MVVGEAIDVKLYPGDKLRGSCGNCNLTNEIRVYEHQQRYHLSAMVIDRGTHPVKVEI
jgi:hypothetical protein